MKQKSCHILFYILLSVLLPFPAEAESMSALKRDLRQNRDFTSMERQIREYLEDRKEYLQTGIENGTISKEEEKKILRALERIRTQFERAKEKEKLTPETKKNIYRQIHQVYRLIWFCSRPAGIFVYQYNGKKFYLMEPWQTKFRKSALSNKEMEEILNTLNRIWRLQNFIKDSNKGISKEEKKAITLQAEKVLLEKYFTLQKVSLPEKKNAGTEKKNIKKNNSEKKKHPSGKEPMKD